MRVSSGSRMTWEVGHPAVALIAYLTDRYGRCILCCMEQQRKAIGRPRAFDADKALEKAMRVFWAQGYEGASLTDLTRAMGINRTSMYAAFGNKEDLFRQALKLYTAGPASYAVRAMQEPTARQVAAAFLRGAAYTTTSPSDPSGCLGVQGSLAAGTSGRVARELLAAWRDEGMEQLNRRFKLAVAQGDLPADSDPVQLARYVVVVANGISVQAVSGASREDLETVADMALKAWPFV